MGQSTGDEIELTPEERRAIAALERLAKRWPSSLMLWGGGCGSGPLRVMRGHPCKDGRRANEITVASINIPNDGGDPD